MDPKVEKLLEGKSTEYKFQAIAFSVACTLTRPTGNTSPEISILDRELKRSKKEVEMPKFSFEETSDEEELDD